ncbi:MAG: signal peptidase I [Phycisphaeraceae bacterium]|nr:MAG: signal peptidase I [Phycisphaeraceae bacterium]
MPTQDHPKSPRSEGEADPSDGGVPDTLIALITAFVIAMAFRGFVVEGFVIPTGSMAPTLLGDHLRITSPETGYDFAVDASDRTLDDVSIDPRHVFSIADPMGRPEDAVIRRTRDALSRSVRPGDRVLVHKWLYTFTDPGRYDVIVFKNPTRPHENYIKRLVGLPGEELWLADGDVFTRRADQPQEPFRIQRKPVHVQRAVWQPVHDSSYRPSGADAEPLDEAWIGGARTESGRDAWRVESSGRPLLLEWDNRRRALDDWNAYNMLGRRQQVFPVSDLRVRAAIEPETAGFQTSLHLTARGHRFAFSIAGSTATVRYGLIGDEDNPSAVHWIDSRGGATTAFRPGRTTEVEFWHVDQAMSIWIDGREVVRLEYDWTPEERLRHATGRSVEEVLERGRSGNPWVGEYRPSSPTLQWSLEGAPAVIHRAAVDRDLYYQPATLYTGGPPAMATHPKATAVLGPDHFFMCGDNSAASHDSRKWGDPDDLVAEQIDEAPYVVHRRLLVGRAWCVYFPAPLGLSEEGSRFIPDFGRMRLIR